MTGALQPLAQEFPIVTPDGKPTEYFIRWAQQRQIDISDGITEAQAKQLIEDWSAGRSVLAGTGLDGGGPLSSDVTLNLADTAVTPGTYGSSTKVPVIDVDQQGRLTNITEVTVSGGGGGGGLWYFNPPPLSIFTDVANSPNPVEDPDTGLQIYDGAADINGLGYAIPSPGADWHCTVHVVSGLTGSGAGGYGIGTYNAARNKFFLWTVDARNWMHFYRMNLGGYDGYEVNRNPITGNAPSWFRYRYVASTGEIHCDYSYDGKIWAQDVFVRNITGDMGGNPTWVGPFVDRGSVGYVLATYDHWDFGQP